MPGELSLLDWIGLIVNRGVCLSGVDRSKSSRKEQERCLLDGSPGSGPRKKKFMMNYSKVMETKVRLDQSLF